METTMRLTKIASIKPFEGAPQINCSAIFGASPKKPIIFRIPVSGERPVTYSATLPEGLQLDGNIITGSIAEEGDYSVTLVAENSKGRAEKQVTLEIKEGNLLVTPLLGFTSWNAFGSEVTQQDMIDIANKMVESGIAEYGYSYVNLDSGWQHEYGGEFDAIMPNFKFPDMKEMTDRIHALGFKCGIYSTPMLNAWGCPKEFASIPGCTVGAPDHRFTSRNGGIGVVHKEENNAKQWEVWGFDYLKYDWNPADPINAELMREALVARDRDFGFCVTVMPLYEYYEYWSRYCNSFRANVDSLGFWDNFMKIYPTYLKYYHFVNKGHFFDMDMLDTGTCRPEFVKSELSEDEQIVIYSARAFFGSPIQISSTLENLDDFELSLYCNDEIIAINQDEAFFAATPIFMNENDGSKVHIYEKLLKDGSYAYAIFNLNQKGEHVRMTFEGESLLRDVWAKEDMGTYGEILMPIPAHTVKIIKSQKKRRGIECIY